MNYALVKSYLHLSHDGMVLAMREEGAVVGVGALVDVLNLETAFLEEPILDAGNDFVHVFFVVNIEVEEVVGSYYIEVVEKTD
jgi:hypothetical protein